MVSQSSSPGAVHAQALVRTMPELRDKVAQSWPKYHWFHPVPGQSESTLPAYAGVVTLEDNAHHYERDEANYVNRPLKEQYAFQPTVIRPRTNYREIKPGTLQFIRSTDDGADAKSLPHQFLSSRSGTAPLSDADKNIALDIHDLIVTFDGCHFASTLHLHSFLTDQLADLNDIVAIAPASMDFDTLAQEIYSFTRPDNIVANLGNNVPSGRTGISRTSAFRARLFARRFIAQLYHAEGNHLGALIFDRRCGHLYIFDSWPTNRPLRVSMVVMMWSRLLREIGLPYNFVYHVLPITRQPNWWSCGYLSAYWIVRTLRGLVGRPLDPRELSHEPLQPLDQHITSTLAADTPPGELPLTDWAHHWSASDCRDGISRSWTVFTTHLFAMYSASCGVLSSGRFDSKHRPSRTTFDFSHWVEPTAVEIRKDWAENTSALTIYGGLLDVDSNEEHFVYFAEAGRVFHAGNAADFFGRRSSPPIALVSAIDPSHVSPIAAKIRNDAASDIRRLEILATHIPVTPDQLLSLNPSSPPLLDAAGQPIICPNIISRRKLPHAELACTTPFHPRQLHHERAVFEVTTLPVSLCMKRFSVRKRSIPLSDGTWISLAPPNLIRSLADSTDSVGKSRPDSALHESTLQVTLRPRFTSINQSSFRHAEETRASSPSSPSTPHLNKETNNQDPPDHDEPLVQCRAKKKRSIQDSADDDKPAAQSATKKKKKM